MTATFSVDSEAVTIRSSSGEMLGREKRKKYQVLVFEGVSISHMTDLHKSMWTVSVIESVAWYTASLISAMKSGV